MTSTIYRPFLLFSKAFIPLILIGMSHFCLSQDIQNYITLGDSLKNKGQYAVSLDNYLKAERLSIKQNQSKNEGLILQKIGSLYDQWGVPQNAIKYYKRSVTLLGSSYYTSNQIAQNHLIINEKDSAIVYFKKLLDYPETKHSINKQNEIHFTLSTLYKDKGKLEEAITHNAAILKNARATNDTLEIIQSNNNLGVLYSNLNKKEESLSFFKQSYHYITLFQQNDKEKAKLRVLINLGSIQLTLFNINEAKNHFDEALKIAKEQDEKYYISQCYNHISSVYLTKGQYHLAKKHAEISLENSLNLNSNQLQAESFKILYTIAMREKNYKTALLNYQKMKVQIDSMSYKAKIHQEQKEDKATETTFKEQQLKQLQVDSEISQMSLKRLELESQKRAQELEVLRQNDKLKELAVQNEKLFKEKAIKELHLTKSILLTEQKNQDIELLTRDKEINSLKIKEQDLEEIEKQKEIELLTKEKENQELKIKQENTTKTYFLYGLLTSLFFILLIFSNLAKLRISRKKLQKSKNEVEQKSIELGNTLNNLQTTQKQLIESEKMASLGGLVAGVAHEINTPVGISVTASTHFDAERKKLLALLNSGNMKKSDLMKFLSTSEEVADILETNLLRASELIKSFKSIAVDQSAEDCRKFELNNYLNSTIRSISPKLRSEGHHIEFLACSPVMIQSFPGALSQVITNLFLNSVIHAYEPNQKGVLSLKSEFEGNKVTLIYKDDGRGIPPENIEKIFEPFFTTNRQGGGSGLGLHIIYNLVNQRLKGNITCKSELGKGAEFKITFETGINEEEYLKAS